MRWQDWVQGQAAYSALGLGGARHWDLPARVSRCFILLMVLLAIAILVSVAIGSKKTDYSFWDKCF